MKKILSVSAFISANIKMASAATGQRSDDYLVLGVPLALLILAWVGYEAKAKYKAWKERKAEEASVADTVGEL